MRNEGQSLLSDTGIPPAFMWMLATSALGLQSQISDGQEPPVARQQASASAIVPDNEAMDEALSEKAENPLTDLINVPIQTNFQFNTGSSNATVEVIKLQPVIPFRLNQNWNLITRTIVPIINQPSDMAGASSAFGLGDINPAFYFSPSSPSAVTWGFGPTLTLPTGTDDSLTSGEWSAGPAVGLVFKHERLVTSLLMNNQWSFAGWRDKDVNKLTIQPAISYQLGDGWYFTYSPTMTADWEAASNDRWTVPLGGGLGKLVHIDQQAIKLSAQAFENVVHATGSSDWSVRFQVQFLFPK